MVILENYTPEFNDILLSSTIAIILILAVLSIRQFSRYNRLRDAIKTDLNELKRQEIAIKKIGEELKEYKISGGEELEHWSRIEKELAELSQLPSLTENENEIILKTHISRARKDFVDVTATEKGINIHISDKESPLHSSYAIPKRIDPSRLTVTYKGNTLEIRAPKIISEEK